MPYPISHLMFFLLCIAAVMFYVTIATLLRKELTKVRILNVMILLFVGGLAALLPDVMAVYSILVDGTKEHCSIGSVPTHSIFFSFTAITLGLVVGYLIYRKYGKAFYMAVFAESAFLSHLLLDDLARYEMDYFYPIYNTPISIFSHVDSCFARENFLYYLLACYVAITALFIVIMMALFSLNNLGFEFKFRSEK